MKYGNLEILKPYRITKNSSDGTFIIGDIIWTSENGDINSIQGKGFIPFSECENDTLDFEAEFTKDWEVIKTAHSEICRHISR